MQERDGRSVKTIVTIATVATIATIARIVRIVRIVRVVIAQRQENVPLKEKYHKAKSSRSVGAEHFDYRREAPPGAARTSWWPPPWRVR
jgi:hypothetical protein